MLILCPFANQHESAKVMDTNCRMSTVHSAVQVATVLHQTSDLVDKKLLRHPTVRFWRGYEVFMLGYAMTLLDYQGSLDNTEVVEKMMSEMSVQLARHLDLATTDEYTLEPPKFWGHELFHEMHRNFMVTMWPTVYTDWLASDDATWVNLFPWPGH